MSTSLGDNGSQGAVNLNGLPVIQYNAGGTQGRTPSVTCTQGSGALTFGLNPCVLDFRQTTLTTGVTVPRLVNSALSLVLPSGGTLGAVTTVSARLILVAIDNAGTVELAVVNIAGGNDLSETGVINTTAISASSTANNVFYSTTARTGVAYRVVGAVDAVNTAGAWGNPTLVQGMGGNANFSLKAAGKGLSFTNVLGSRGFNTTYYNTSTWERYVTVGVTGGTGASQLNVTINGVTVTFTEGGSGYAVGSFILQPGDAYSVQNNSGGSPTLNIWIER